MRIAAAKKMFDVGITDLGQTEGALAMIETLSPRAHSRLSQPRF
jgi:hypothetical protein